MMRYVHAAGRKGQTACHPAAPAARNALTTYSLPTALLFALLVGLAGCRAKREEQQKVARLVDQDVKIVTKYDALATANWEMKDEIGKAEVIELRIVPSIDIPSAVVVPSAGEAKAIVEAAKADNDRWPEYARIFLNLSAEDRAARQRETQAVIDEARSLSHYSQSALLDLANRFKKGDRETEIRAGFAVWVLGELSGSPWAYKALWNLLQSKEENLRAGCLSTIAVQCQRGHQRLTVDGIHRFLGYARDPSSRVRLMTIDSLNFLRDTDTWGINLPGTAKDVLSTLLAATSDTDCWVRTRAAAGLAQSDDPAALKLLQTLAASDPCAPWPGYYPVREAARDSVIAIEARTVDGPEREEGVKPIPPAPFLSVHAIFQYPGGKPLETPSPELGPGIQLRLKDTDKLFVIDPIAILTERSLVRAARGADRWSKPVPIVTFSDEGRTTVRRYESRHSRDIKGYVLLLNGELVSELYWPHDGRVQGHFTQAEVDELVDKVNAGRANAPVQ